jgi:pilus assembly protein FimV
MVRKFKLKPWVYAGLLALAPLSVDAAGLGKLTVTSGLGQPLRAEIELVAVQAGELDSLAARLASAEAFSQAGIERSGALSNIRFSVEKKKTGKPVLKLSTAQPLNEPFLDMLVELNWAAGRLLREYTVLLDPPGYVEPQAVQPVVAPVVTAPPAAEPVAPVAESAPAAPTPSPVAQEEAKPETAPPAKAEQQPASRKTTRSKPSVTETPPASSGDAKSYSVKKGDTLTAIAKDLTPPGLSLEQMLVALYQANKQAFSANNMNRLKSGQILRVPDEQQIAATGRAEAAHEVKTHTADWHAYRQKLAAAVGEAPAPKEEAPKQAAQGKITTAVQDKAAPPPAPSKDVLKVTKGEAAASAKETQALQSRIQSLQEEATAKGKSLKEAGERIATLEKSVNDMKQLIELKNKNLAEAQKQAASKPPKVETPTPVKPPEVVTPPKPVEPPKAEEPPKPIEPPKPVEPPKAEEAPKPVEPPKVVEPPKTVEPVVEKKSKPAEKPQPEPGLMDSLMDPLYIGGAVGVLALLGGGMLVYNRRRKKSLSSFEDSILTGGDLKANTVFGETAGGAVDTGDTSFLTDFSQAGLGTIDTNDVDPIAEAEVYMAYGRDAQAEEILKEAMVKDSHRYEVHLKLLEIYAARKNLIAFETLAAELYAAIGGKASALWDKAAEMGRSLDPNNPLYGAQEGHAKSAHEPVTPPPARYEAVEAAPVMVELPDDLDFGHEEAAPVEESASALEFDLGTIQEAPPAEEANEMDEVLDFDFGEIVPAQQVESPVEAQQAAEEEASDFDLDLSPTTEMEAMGGLEAPAASEEEASLDFSLDIPESAPQETKPEAVRAEPESIVLDSLPAEDEEAHLDFDFDLGGQDTLSPADAGEQASETLPELDLGGISLNLEEPATPSASEAPAALDDASSEAATKLDLARAYVEMGDKEGAKEILEEVQREGNAQQQADANRLLASL